MSNHCPDINDYAYAADSLIGCIVRFKQRSFLWCDVYRNRKSDDENRFIACVEENDLGFVIDQLSDGPREVKVITRVGIGWAVTKPERVRW